MERIRARRLVDFDGAISRNEADDFVADNRCAAFRQLVVYAFNAFADYDYFVGVDVVGDALLHDEFLSR